MASLYSDRIIVEQLKAAETVRLLFLDGVMIHAVRRTGVRVTGDGSSTIEQLLGRVGSGAVLIDRFVHWTLSQQGLSVDDIPAAGITVVARWLPRDVDATRELRTIYQDDVTELISPELVDEIRPVVTALGTRFAGVDLLTNDPGRTLAASGGVFIEMNTTPGLHHHCSPSPDGTACDVAVKVLRSAARSSGPMMATIREIPRRVGETALRPLDVPLSTAAWYGDPLLPLSFPPEWDVVVHGPDLPEPIDATGIRAAMDRPVQAPKLRELASGVRRVVIVVDDLTRPTPVEQVLPIVLDELGEAGVQREDVTVLVAAGTHGPPSIEAMQRKVGRSADGCRLVAHDDLAPGQEGRRHAASARRSSSTARSWPRTS